jgi:large subunit ribosomal protein L30e
MSKALERAIKDSLVGNKCRVGTREVLRSLNSSKLIVCSRSLSEGLRNKIMESAKALNVPIYDFDSSSVELGKLCNKPFRISAISIDGSSSSDISSILEEIGKRATSDS